MAKLNPEVVKKMTDKELLQKKTELEFLVAKYNSYQLAMKTLSNACYGACGNKYFRYYDPRLAGSITLSGRYVIRTIDKKINEYLNHILKTKDEDYVIFSHTDSMYIRLDGIVKKIFKDREDVDPEEIVKTLEKVCIQKIYPKIQRILSEVADYINAFENKMNMKLEIIADRGVWTGKNRYIMNVYYKEGTFYRHPTIKAVGVETVKSSIPSMCREKIKKAIEIVLREDALTLRKFIKKFHDEYFAFPIEDIAIPMGVKGGLTKYGSDVRIYIKGTPKHVKGCLLYNHNLRKLKLDKKYKTIREGDKIKFLTLKQPNPINETVIAFPDILPPEFGLHNYIDRESIFKVTFLNPVEKIANAAKYKLVEKVSIESIFGKNYEKQSIKQQ